MPKITIDLGCDSDAEDFEDNDDFYDSDEDS